MPFVIIVIKVLTQQEVFDILKYTKRIRQQNCSGRLLYEGGQYHEENRTFAFKDNNKPKNNAWKTDYKGYANHCRADTQSAFSWYI